MNAGVLIAGSLAWGSSEVRDAWRADRLEMADRVHVHAPLRYGRRSRKRGGTFTMVFAASCVSNGGATGVGLAVPFAEEWNTPEDLVMEATRLWAAEDERAETKEGILSAEWGSVGLLPNPDRRVSQEFLERWREVVSGSPHYGELATAGGEAAVLDPSTGLATFPWPRRTDGQPLELDALLFTATDPEIVRGRYPSVPMIADAWNRSPARLEYFRQNRRMGIVTAEDPVIEELLGASAAVPPSHHRTA